MNEIVDSRFVAVSVARMSNAKKAAIYFDYVVPIYCDDVPREIFPPHFGDWIPRSNTQLLTQMQQHYGEKNIAVDFEEADGSLRSFKLTDSNGEPDLETLELANELMFLRQPKLRAKLQEQMCQALIPSAPVLLSPQPLEFTRPTTTATEVSITLAGMPLIELEGVPWEQILELRMDVEAHKKLQLLRLFLADELIGKTPEQIQANVERGLDEYSRTAEQHGFKLFIGVLQESCSSKELMSSVALGALFGSQVAPGAGATIGSLMGATLQLANVSLTCAKGLHDLAQIRRFHPLSYLIEAEKQLSPYSQS